VLTSKDLYGVTRQELVNNLLPLLAMPGLRVEGKPLVERAFRLYLASAIDFVDAYHAALVESRGQADVVSYDRHFDRVPGIHRREP